MDSPLVLFDSVSTVCARVKLEGVYNYYGTLNVDKIINDSYEFMLEKLEIDSENRRNIEIIGACQKCGSSMVYDSHSFSD